MDFSHDAIAALRSGNLYTYEGVNAKPDRDAQRRYFAWLAAGIEKAQKFDFTGIQKTFNKELLRTAGDALWHGLLAVPFNPSFFNFREVDEEHGFEFDSCVLVFSSDKHEIVMESIAKTRTRFGAVGPGQWLIPGIRTIFRRDPEREGEFFVEPSSDASVTGRVSDEQAHGNVIATSTLVLQALVCLVARGIKLQSSTPSVVMNKIRKAHGKVPMMSHNIVVIDPERVIRETDAPGGTHASPRLHWRRGCVHRAHERALSDGRRVAVAACVVPACLVGDPSAGMVAHDYKVVSSQAPAVEPQKFSGAARRREVC